jgi:hypothetical protein
VTVSVYESLLVDVGCSRKGGALDLVGEIGLRWVRCLGCLVAWLVG